MKDSRTRNLSVAAALAALGIASVAASCTGPKATKAQPGAKTTGPVIAKGDKTTATPEAPTKPAGDATMPTRPVADGDPVPPPKPGVPLPPPTKPKKVPTVVKPKPPVKPTVVKPKPPIKPTKPAVVKPKPPVKPAVVKPKPPVKPAVVKPKPPVKPTVVKPKPPVKPTKPTVVKPAVVKPKPPADPTKPTAAKPPVKPGVGAKPVKPTKPTVVKPKPPVKPTKPAVVKPTKPTKPAVTTAQTEADRILEARLKELQIEQEKNRILVSDFLQQAREAAARFDHDATAEWATRALQIDHDNDEAERLLRQALAANGDREASVKSLADLMVDQVNVRREQARFVAQQHWHEAMKSKSGGDYESALASLQKALGVVHHDPSGVDWGTMKRDIENEIAAVGEMKKTADKDARALAARGAYRQVKEEEAKRRLAEVERKNALFGAAMDAFEAENWGRAEILLKDFLAEEPEDRNAQMLLITANRAKHNRAADDTIKLQRERIKEWRLAMEETTIPYHKILNWPSQKHWTRITELRKDAGLISAPDPESPETTATMNKLRSERIGFDYTEANFTDVVDYIKDARGLNIVIDGEVASELEAVPISLKLSDIPVADALNTLLSVAGGDLTYVVEGSIVLITKTELARGEPVVQVHSIGDLTVQLTNFIAPNLNLLPTSAEEDEENPRFGGASEGVPPFGGADELVTLITGNVADEDYWSSDGVSINPSGEDKLVVVAEPKIQGQVASFLNDLRAFSGLVVTIETRFLTVTDNFLRDVGVDIRGLGPDILGGSAPLALLDDVTNGLTNNASAGFDNFGVGVPANANGRPTSGAFFNNNSDGDYRARTEHVFDRALGTKVSNIGGALVQYTLVDDTNLSLILRAVEKTQEGRVLQAPSVTVFNTQRANITLINQLTFIQDFDVEVAQTAFIADPIVGIIQDGLVLDVQPTVSHDRKYITLQLQPTVATLVRPIPTFTTSLGAFTTPVTIQIPELVVQRAATTIRVPDGGTLLMGGLKNINMADLKSETPWFSSIPFASFLLGRKGSVKEMENLMVIVTATISDLHEQENRLRK